MSVTSIRRFHSLEEAIVAQSKLEAYGILSWIPESHMARSQWVYLQGAGGCHIEVPSSCVDDACFLLKPDERFELKDFDPYETPVSYKIALWLALIGAVGHLAVLPLLDHLYCWWKRKFKSPHPPQ